MYKIIRNIFIISLFVVFTMLCACKKDVTTEFASVEPPNMNKMNGEYNLDFVDMHNFVIDSLQERGFYFFIKTNSFSIDGDNKKKLIKVNCTCLDGTVVEEANLLLSDVLKFIGMNAAEQDYRFVAPKIDKNDSNVYIDFGTVFNTYDLEVSMETESGSILRKDYVKAGGKMPVDSRIWSE